MSDQSPPTPDSGALEARVVPIPAYDPAAICPKCGQTPVGTKACSTSTPPHSFLGSYHSPMWVEVVGSHLHRTCGRCEHSWIELALDARMMTPEESQQQRDDWTEDAKKLREWFPAPNYRPAASPPGSVDASAKPRKWPFGWLLG